MRSAGSAQSSAYSHRQLADISASGARRCARARVALLPEFCQQSKNEQRKKWICHRNGRLCRDAQLDRRHQKCDVFRSRRRRRHGECDRHADGDRLQFVAAWLDQDNRAASHSTPRSEFCKRKSPSVARRVSPLAAELLFIAKSIADFVLPAISTGADLKAARFGDRSFSLVLYIALVERSFHDTSKGNADLVRA